MDFRRDDLVVIRDYPFGKKTKIKGVVVGILGGDYYNVLIKNGLSEGKIIKFKYWKIEKDEELKEDTLE